MKRLKIFEEFKVGSFYTSSKDDSMSQTQEVSGYSVKIIDKKEAGSSVYTVTLVLASGSVMLLDLCFSELKEAKNYISDVVKEFEDSNLKIGSFVIKRLSLDLVSSSGSASQSSGVMDLGKDFPNFLEKNLNPIVNSYSKILKSNSLSQDKLTTSLKEMIRICKTGDMNRISPFLSNFVKMIRPLYSENNKNSWDLTSDGRKWKSVIDQFETTIGLREISGGPIVKY
jgi:hypothetical protein